MVHIITTKWAGATGFEYVYMDGFSVSLPIKSRPIITCCGLDWYKMHKQIITIIIEFVAILRNYFLAWALLVLFPSSSPIWPFNFWCSCFLLTSFDFSEEEKEDEEGEERASLHSFWDCLRAILFASSPQPWTSAWWWVKQKRREQKSHCSPMSDKLALHLTEWGRGGGRNETCTYVHTTHTQSNTVFISMQTCPATGVRSDQRWKWC